MARALEYFTQILSGAAVPHGPQSFTRLTAAADVERSRHHPVDFRKRAEAERGDEPRFQFPAAGHGEPRLLFGFADRRIAHPYFGHGAQIGRDIEVDVKAWVDGA